MPDQLSQHRLCRWAGIHDGDPPQLSVDRMSNDHILDAGVLVARSFIPRPSADQVNEALSAGGNVDSKCTRTIQT